ncbi:MAG: DMT family transporter [Deltaproteobacteria bacterium]|nr:DMT family transporter [Deltaproteobacteria bacterium]
MWTLAGVVGFSGSLPATRVAVQHLDPVTVGLGRAVVAAVVAAALLLLARAPRPALRELPALGLVAACVVVGFPLISAFALRELPAGRGAVVLAVAPLSTAAFAAWLGRERTTLGFWLRAGVGTSAVLGYVATTAGGFGAADLKLLLAAVVVGLGYAEGARLSRARPGWQVIGWALVLAAPVLAVVTPWPPDLGAVPAAGLAAFAYVSLISMFLGFVAWYSGLARGGAARMGQLQLLQPFLTLLWSGLLLGEPWQPAAWWAVAVVVGCIAAGWWVRPRPRPDSAPAWSPGGARRRA